MDCNDNKFLKTEKDKFLKNRSDLRQKKILARQGIFDFDGTKKIDLLDTSNWTEEDFKERDQRSAEYLELARQAIKTGMNVQKYKLEKQEEQINGEQ